PARRRRGRPGPPARPRRRSPRRLTGGACDPRHALLACVRATDARTIRRRRRRPFVDHAAPRQMEPPRDHDGRPGRRRVLATLGALPAGAALTAAGSAHAAPTDRGKGKGKGKGGRFRLGVENLLQPRRLRTLRGARVGLITNPTGTDRELRSTIDLLVGAQEEGGFTMAALFGPEHGVRGAEPAGGAVGDYIDEKTGLPVRSLYGATQKPTPEMLADLDLLVFDIQDIGTRFYTYIWTMYYAMEAAAENGKRFLVLDRPNPLGSDIEGFVLEPELSSFVGLREIPQTHGLTVGELARLFNGEFLDGAVSL